MTISPGVRGPLRFLDRTYAETCDLLVQARDFLQAGEGHVGTPDDVPGRLTVMLEMTRLTTMLTQVIAWLMVQRAIDKGEMTRVEAAKPEHRLGGHDVCRDDRALADENLPARLRELLAEAHRLYCRINRLDEMLGRDVAADDRSVSA